MHASKAELWSELNNRQHKLARQRSELAARERAAPKINDELFVLAAESLRGVQDATKLAAAHLDGDIDERLGEARDMAAQSMIAVRSNARPVPRPSPSLTSTPRLTTRVCSLPQFIGSRLAARSRARSASSPPTNSSTRQAQFERTTIRSVLQARA